MDLLLYVFAFRFIAQTFEISGPQAALLFSITLASSALGGMVFGVISDYVGRVKALTYSILIYSLFMLPTLIVPYYLKIYSLVFFIPAILLTSYYIYLCAILCKAKKREANLIAKKIFIFTIAYLFLLFLLILFDSFMINFYG